MKATISTRQVPMPALPGARMKVTVRFPHFAFVMNSVITPKFTVPLLNQYPADLPMTPLIPIQLSPEAPVIWCKLEFLNPSGSTKDRIARYILGNALKRGQLKRGSTVIEASSGSTSIAMALVCAQHGLRFAAVLPEGVSNERVLMIRAYGGEHPFRQQGLRDPGMHCRSGTAGWRGRRLSAAAILEPRKHRGSSVWNRV